MYVAMYTVCVYIIGGNLSVCFYLYLFLGLVKFLQVLGLSLNDLDKFHHSECHYTIG